MVKFPVPLIEIELILIQFSLSHIKNATMYCICFDFDSRSRNFTLKRKFLQRINFNSKWGHLKILIGLQQLLVNVYILLHGTVAKFTVKYSTFGKIVTSDFKFSLKWPQALVSLQPLNLSNKKIILIKVVKYASVMKKYNTTVMPNLNLTNPDFNYIYYHNSFKTTFMVQLCPKIADFHFEGLI